MRMGGRLVLETGADFDDGILFIESFEGYLLVTPFVWER